MRRLSSIEIKTAQWLTDSSLADWRMPYPPATW
jgi:hypothetical protein